MIVRGEVVGDTSAVRPKSWEHAGDDSRKEYVRRTRLRLSQ
jgi:hypothetical protein